MPVKTCRHKVVKSWPGSDESWRQQFVKLAGIDVKVSYARGHGACVPARCSVKKFCGVAADGVYELACIVERNAARSTTVVDACREFVFQDVLDYAAHVAAIDWIPEFVGVECSRATWAESVTDPVYGTGASARCVVHRERHSEHYSVGLDS